MTAWIPSRVRSHQGSGAGGRRSTPAAPRGCDVARGPRPGARRGGAGIPERRQRPDLAGDADVVAGRERRSGSVERQGQRAGRRPRGLARPPPGEPGGTASAAPRLPGHRPRAPRARRDRARRRARGAADRGARRAPSPPGCRGRRPPRSRRRASARGRSRGGARRRPDPRARARWVRPPRDRVRRRARTRGRVGRSGALMARRHPVWGRVGVPAPRPAGAGSPTAGRGSPSGWRGRSSRPS